MYMRSKFRVLRCPLSALLCGMFALCASGCSDDETVVSASLREFEVDLSRTSVPEGSVTFEVMNDGTEEHEFLVIRTDLAEDALPTEEDGSYLENGPGTVLVDEIEEIQPGEAAELTLDLHAGTYVIICNRVEVEADGETEAHYALGMHTSLLVTTDED